MKSISFGDDGEEENLRGDKMGIFSDEINPALKLIIKSLESINYKKGSDDQGERGYIRIYEGPGDTRVCVTISIRERYYWACEEYYCARSWLKSHEKEGEIPEEALTSVDDFIEWCDEELDDLLKGFE